MAQDPELAEFRGVLEHMAATLASGEALNTQQASQRCQRALNAAIGLGTFRLRHATGVMDMLRTTTFSAAQRRSIIRVANNGVREVPLRAAPGVGAAIPSQSCESWWLYASAEVWRIFAEAPWEEAKVALANRCMEIGLTNPTEPTVRSIVACWFCARAPPDQLPWIDADDGLVKKREAVAAIRLSVASGIAQHIGEIVDYPGLQELQHRHPDYFQDVFGPDNPPQALPDHVTIQKLQYAIRRLPCRSSSALVRQADPVRMSAALPRPALRQPSAVPGVDLPGFRLLGDWWPQ